VLQRRRFLLISDHNYYTTAMVSKIHLNGPNDSIVDILQGKERIVSYPGTSQFNGRGISACGLAAMNFARILSDLIYIHGQNRMLDLLRVITSKEVIQVSVLSDLAPVRSSGRSPSPLLTKHHTIGHYLHLLGMVRRLALGRGRHPADSLIREVTEACINTVRSPKGEAFQAYPRVSQSFVHQCRHLHNLLRYMQTLSFSATVIITRPPEIIACTLIKGSETDVFVIFDSHPRTSYPAGAGIILNTSIDQAVSRLVSILPAADSNLLSLSGLQWQAQLLNHVSGHIFVSNGPPADMRGMQHTVVESSLAVLRLRAEVAGLTQKNERLAKENETLEGEVQRLDDALSVERKKVVSLRAPSKIVQDSSAQHFTSLPLPSRLSNGIAGPSRLAPLDSSSSSDKMTNNDRGRDAGAWSSPYDTVKEDIGHEWGLDSPSSAVALKLQQSFDVEDLQLRDQMRTLAALLPHSFSCVICMEEQPVDNSVDLKCNHSICRTCIRGHICSKIEEHRFPVLCPVCMTEKDNRQPAGLYISIVPVSSSPYLVISGLLVQQIGVDERQYAIWEEMELSQLSVLLHCHK
jgi:hypothetical protein